MALRVATLAGRRLVVEVPTDTPGLDDVAATPGQFAGADALRWEGGGLSEATPAGPVAADLTTLGAAEVVRRACGGGQPCDLSAAERRTLPDGAAYVRWGDVARAGSGVGYETRLATVERAGWTLVLESLGGDLDAAAEALTWSVDDDGFPRLAPSRPGAAVEVGADVVTVDFVHLGSAVGGGGGLRLQVGPPCAEGQEPELALRPCVDGLRVSAGGDEASARRLLEGLRVARA